MTSSARRLDYQAASSARRKSFLRRGYNWMRYYVGGSRAANVAAVAFTAAIFFLILLGQMTGYMRVLIRLLMIH
jgi:hypothetical protein